MSPAVQLQDVSKRYSSVAALEHVDLSLDEHTVHGLLGRNGAGKTTLLKLLAGHEVASGGQVHVFGEPPYENESVLSQVCFVSETQHYPDTLEVGQAMAAAGLAFPHWDAALADELVAEFELPTGRRIAKLSRGMRSAVGIIIGLAARAPLTCFDEPYLGLDAVARQLFYDRLLAEIAEQPRTVVLSTHLIDEVADLIEHVVIIDHGRILLDEDAEALRARAVSVAGPAPTVEHFAASRPQLHREDVGGFARITLDGGLDPAGRAEATTAGLEVEALSLQQLVVRTTAGAAVPGDRRPDEKGTS